MADEFEDVGYRARTHVCGFRKAETRFNPEMNGKWIVNTGGWSKAFHAHPLTELADAEGWAKELRQHCIRVVERQMAADQPYDDIDKLMPDPATIRHWQDKAHREALAAQWRAEVVAQYGSMDNYLQNGRIKTAARFTSKPIGSIAREVVR